MISVYLLLDLHKIFYSANKILLLSVSQSLFYYHKQQVGYKCPPILYLDGICTFSIEVFQREVLFYIYLTSISISQRLR